MEEEIQKNQSSKTRELHFKAVEEKKLDQRII
jgi:hypothetical protein